MNTQLETAKQELQTAKADFKNLANVAGNSIVDEEASSIIRRIRHWEKVVNQTEKERRDEREYHFQRNNEIRGSTGSLYADDEELI